MHPADHAACAPQSCKLEDTCEHLRLCLNCARTFNGLTQCDICAVVLCCSGCCSVRCLMAPACKLAVCDGCVARHPLLFMRCSDCGAVACPDHTYLCHDCASPDEFKCRSRFGEVQFRAMMRCCACKRAYCFNCDGTHSGAGAFPGIYPDDMDEWMDENAVRTPEKVVLPVFRPWYAEDVTCLYCTRWPGFCNGLEEATLTDLDAVLKSWADCDCHYAEKEAAYAADEAAEAAQAATNAALVAAELAIEASVKAEKARDAAAISHQWAAVLAHGRATADELAARARR